MVLDQKVSVESRVALAAHNAVKRKATNQATVEIKAQNDGEIMIFHRESRQQFPKSCLLVRDQHSNGFWS
jgi:hypothetical protein